MPDLQSTTESARETAHQPESARPHRLSVTGVSVSYRDQRGVSRPAVRSVSFDVDAGEFVALVGPSGCGKSTLLNAIAGLVEPDEGTVALDGDVSERRLGRVAYMQQRDLLLPWRTVLQNARLGLEFRGVQRAEADRLAVAGAQRFGLGDVLGSYPWQLSGGMRQRVALLRSSLPQSGVLLLDEPFGALDAITRRDLQQWLADVLDRSNRAVVLVTHDVEEALLLADRVYVMSAGPGTLTESVEVGLPRPRTEETVTSPRFVELKRRLLAALSSASTVAPR